MLTFWFILTVVAIATSALAAVVDEECYNETISIREEDALVNSSTLTGIQRKYSEDQLIVTLDFARVNTSPYEQKCIALGGKFLVYDSVESCTKFDEDDASKTTIGVKIGSPGCFGGTCAGDASEIEAILVQENANECAQLEATITNVNNISLFDRGGEVPTECYDSSTAFFYYFEEVNDLKQDVCFYNNCTDTDVLTEGLVYKNCTFYCKDASAYEKQCVRLGGQVFFYHTSRSCYDEDNVSNALVTQITTYKYLDEPHCLGKTCTGNISEVKAWYSLSNSGDETGDNCTNVTVRTPSDSTLGSSPAGDSPTTGGSESTSAGRSRRPSFPSVICVCALILHGRNK
jgi:hypothetical protein